MPAADFETIIDIDGRRKKVLRDGHVARVPMYLRDSKPNPTLSATQQAIAASRRQLTDAELRSCKPGFRFANKDAALRDAKAEAKAKVYAAYDAAISSAYLTPPTGVGSANLRGAQEGDVCTVRGPEFPDAFGRPGHMRMRNGQLVCVPDNNACDAAAATNEEATCPDCGGDGEINGQICQRCGGSGEIGDHGDNEDDIVVEVETNTEGSGRNRTDNRSVNQIMRDHQTRMSKLYADIDRDLAEQWRRS
jgi:hypothetical protein